MSYHESLPQNPARSKIVQLVLLSLTFIVLSLVMIYIWKNLHRGGQSGDQTGSKVSPSSGGDLSSLASTITSTVSSTSPILIDTLKPPTDIAVVSEASIVGTIILAMGEGGTTHLFAYQPNQPLIRLTEGPWQDITPAFSTDGGKLAFASNRGGYWDIYIMDLNVGELVRLTDSPEYDGSPSWSPDGHWLAYESYVMDEQGGNLEIIIRSLDGSQEPIRLTDELGADFSPTWSPIGRQIAFISTRSGENEVWLANLDRPTDRFQNISNNPRTVETHPAWSPDGSLLSWSSMPSQGFQEIVIWDSGRSMDPPLPLNVGDWSAWSPKEDMLIVTLQMPNQIYLTGYNLQDQNLVIPIQKLNGSVEGISWGKTSWVENLPDWVEKIPQDTPTPLWNAVLVSMNNLPSQRMELIPLEGVEAPYPLLQDQVDESFNSLRNRVASEIGWDFLAALEQAYVPMTSPLGLGMQEDWLYTARAFRFNTAPVDASWVVIARQDFGPQTYWRIYLRTLGQDGTQGLPLKRLPWNFESRHSGDPLAYELGGSFEKAIPAGYWLDFTELALAYGWERLPALSSWLTSYSSARYNEFALRGGLDWFSAMLQIYPREALNTSTPVSSPTSTPTASDTPLPTSTYTRTPYLSRTPTNTPTPFPTKTKRPTNTPWPTVPPQP